MAEHNLAVGGMVPYDHVAAGHDGMLSDASGQLLIKPCHLAEARFYETCAAEHPEFAALLPTFMGTLTLSTPAQRRALANPDPTSINAALQAQEGTAETLDPADQSLLRGKKIDTETAIVLENVAAGFVKPNILDVKLGARLWADDAPPAKRQRLDKVAGETTSGSLGFRVAGMRVWDMTTGEHRVYDKSYGREFKAETVQEAFQTYFCGGEARKKQPLSESRTAVLQLCRDEVGRVLRVFEEQESRMYSSSILFVYEGKEEALEVAFEEAMKEDEAGKTTEEQDDDGDEDEAASPKIFAVKLIDFAHATWTPGEGPDENVVRGIRSVLGILDKLLEGK